jgi:hypothetical protein
MLELALITLLCLYGLCLINDTHERWPQDRGCSAEPVVTTNHINVEGWTESYASTWAQIERDYPQNAPRNLGNMGFLVEMEAAAVFVFHTAFESNICTDFQVLLDIAFARSKTKKGHVHGFGPEKDQTGVANGSHIPFFSF